MNNSNTILFLKRLFEVIGVILAVSFKVNLSRPEKFRLFFEKTGGAFIKLGQILALRQDFLPSEYISELLKLLSRVPEVSFSEMQKVFIEEIGEPVGKFFSEFDAEPVASASLAQVYKAKLKDGSVVAVKIQRPETKKKFEADFLVVSFLARVIDIFNPFSVVRAKEVSDDFVRWTRRELDFRFESRNAEAFFEFSKWVGGTVIPKQYSELASKRTLIEEFIFDGVPVEDVITGKIGKKELLDKNIDPDIMADYLIKESMRQYFVDGFFHADAHPANLILLRDNRLAFLDFGIVGEARKENRLIFLKFARGLAERDLDAMCRSLMEFGKKTFDGEMEFYLRSKPAKRKTAEAVFEKIKEIILEDFKKEMKVIMSPWFEPDEKNAKKKTSAVLFLRLARKAEKYGIRLPAEVILFFRALAINDMTALQMSPGFDIMTSLSGFFDIYRAEDVEEIINNQDNSAEIDKRISSLTDDWDSFLEASAVYREKMAEAKEKVKEIIWYYAEKYPEVKKMLKKL